jgi:hypothetical protein
MRRTIADHEFAAFQMRQLTHLAAAGFGAKLFRKSRTGAGVESVAAS